MTMNNSDNLRKRKQYGKSVLRRLKTITGCIKCGYKEHHAALEFNHRSPRHKIMNISTQAVTVSLRNSAKSKVRLKEELKKCDVLCAICHRIVTFEEGHQVSERYK